MTKFQGKHNMFTIWAFEVMKASFVPFWCFWNGNRQYSALMTPVKGKGYFLKFDSQTVLLTFLSIQCAEHSDYSPVP